MITRFTLTLPAIALAGVCWRLAQRGLAVRRRRLNLLAIELRLADSLESFHQEVFKLKHYRVLRPTASGGNAGLIPSTNKRSLRYIKGRQHED